MQRSPTIFIVFLFSLLLKGIPAAAQTESVTVWGNQPMDPNIPFMQGFINGGTQFDIPSTQKLKPAFWAVGWQVDAAYDYVKPNFNPKIMASIYSAYMNWHNIGDPMQLQPWTDNWVQWDAFIQGMINMSIQTNRPVDYWSVFGEPDATFSGTPGQYIEMFRRTDSIIKTTDPSAKMVGPDLIGFGINMLLFVIDSLDAVGVHPEAISWHEFGNNPEAVYAHVYQFRDSLAVRPQSGNPEIHIQEYAGPDNRLIPGWNVGWLYYFEKSEIDWASRACFNEFDGNNTWDDCWSGLSGMYMNDGVTPQPLYWLHRAYAELPANGRLETSPAQLRTVALAAKDDAQQEMRIIVGRYDSPYMGTPDPPANVEIKVRNYPYGNNTTQPLLIQKIPAQAVSYTVPLSAPVTVYSGTVSFTGDSVMIALNNFADGDAYIIYINPDMDNILSAENIQPEEDHLVLYPNPAGDYLTISSGYGEITNIMLLDITGKILYEDRELQDEAFTIPLNDYANGIYIVKITGENGNTESEKLIISR